MDVYKKAVCAQLREDIHSYLKLLSREGVRVSIEGHIFPISKTAEIIAVNEEVCYMPDFLRDEKGNLIEVRYDRIALSQKCC